MSAKTLLCIAAIGLIAYPIICVIFSTCVETWFNRKEKHMIWCSDQIKNAQKENLKSHEQV